MMLIHLSHLEFTAFYGLNPETLTSIQGVCANEYDFWVWGCDGNGSSLLFRTQFHIRTEKGNVHWMPVNLPDNLTKIQSIAAQDEHICIQCETKDNPRAAAFSSTGNMKVLKTEWVFLTPPVINTNILSREHSIPEEVKKAYLNTVDYINSQCRRRFLHKKSNNKILEQIEDCLELAAKNALTLEALNRLKENVQRLQGHRKIKENAIVAVSGLTGAFLGAAAGGCFMFFGLVGAVGLSFVAVIVLTVVLAISFAMVLGSLFSIPALNAVSPSRRCTNELMRYSNHFFQAIKPNEENPETEQSDHTLENEKINLD